MGKLLDSYTDTIDVFRIIASTSDMDEVTYTKYVISGVRVDEPSYGYVLYSLVGGSQGATQMNLMTIYHSPRCSTSFTFQNGDIVCKHSDSNVPLESYGVVASVNPKCRMGVLHHTEVVVR